MAMPLELPRIADVNAGEWVEHARFKGIYAKTLLTVADNPWANVNVIRVPPGGFVGRHHHATQIEIICVLTGQAVLTLDQTDLSLVNGQLVAIPMGVEHALRNDGAEPAEVLTIFTPPLV
jgi:quercetin dioxygenase-like cupin family protein